MNITLEIECGERLTPSLEKARKIAELLGVDVVTKVSTEFLRVPHDGNFDIEQAIKQHYEYCERTTPCTDDESVIANEAANEFFEQMDNPYFFDKKDELREVLVSIIGGAHCRMNKARWKRNP
jgi:transcriptional regulator with XRE-family HTH domain